MIWQWLIDPPCVFFFCDLDVRTASHTTGDLCESRHDISDGTTATGMGDIPNEEEPEDEGALQIDCCQGIEGFRACEANTRSGNSPDERNEIVNLCEMQGPRIPPLVTCA